VLIDTSQSIGFVDHRESPDDLKRAAFGVRSHRVRPRLKPALPAKPEQFAALSRHELLRRVAGNAALNLWPRLAEQAELQFYGFGRNASPLSSPVPAEGAFKPAARSNSSAG